MAEIDEIAIVDGVPVSGTGEVPTLAPVRDAVMTLNALVETLADTVAEDRVRVNVTASLPAGSATIGGVNLAQYTPVSGRLPVDGSGVTQPVSGPLTDAQLRATAIPVAVDTLPLPEGAATAANQQTDALTDAELRAAPVPVGGTVTANLGALGGAATADAQDTIIAHLAAVEEHTRLFVPMAGETVAATVTSAQSSVLPEGRVWLRGNVAFHVLNGSNPTATTSHPYVPAGESVYLYNPTGNRFAVRKAGDEGDGTVWISTEAPI